MKVEFRKKKKGEIKMKIPKYDRKLPEVIVW